MAKQLNFAVQISGDFRVISFCKAQGKALVLGTIIAEHIYQPFRGCACKEHMAF